MRFALKSIGKMSKVQTAVAAVVLSFFVAPAVVMAQTVQYLGGEISITASNITNPSGVAVDSAGNLYISDYHSNTVVKIAAGTGQQTLLPATGLNAPYGVAVDLSGNVFIADSGNNRIVELPANGGPQIAFGTGLSSPYGVAVYGSGNLFISDYGHNQIVLASPSAGVQSVWASGIPSPVGIAVDNKGNLFVGASGELLEMPFGSPTMKVLANSGLGSLLSVAVDGAGDVLVADAQRSRIEKLAPGSTSLTTFPMTGLNTPLGVAVDAAGDVYVADQFNSRIAELQLGFHNLGSVNVCPSGQTSPAPCSQTVTLAYNITASGTLGTPGILTQGAPNLDFIPASGDTCTGSVTAGSACTVSVTFAPQFPGLRPGAVQLTNASGTVVNSTYIYGTAFGPQVAFNPLSQSKISTVADGIADVGNIALDGAGNLYISEEISVLKRTPAGVLTAVDIPGLLSPWGVAVDGAGNLFAVDQRLPNVWELTPAGIVTAVPVTGLRAPVGVAVDGVGNVFITDAANNNIVEVTPAGVQTTVVSGINSPGAVALDAAGDLFVTSGGSVLKAPAGGGAPIVLATGISSPEAIAVDAAGDVYVAASSAGVVEIPAGGGSAIAVGSGWQGPDGIAIDAAGDLFVANNGNSPNIVKAIRSQPPSLSFAQTKVGLTSSNSPQSFTVENIGNTALDISGISFSSSDFEQVPGTGTPEDCSSAAPLALGATCNLSVDFVPQTIGSLSENVALTDNALGGNPAIQTIPLSGSATQGNQTINNFNTIPTQIQGTTLTLSATASSSLAVSYSASPANVCTVSGATVTMVSRGTCSITASQAGNANYAAVSVSQFFTVLLLQSITFPELPSNATYGQSKPLTLNATASSGLAVSYSVTGPATLSGSTLTFTGAGTVTVTASQAGNATYAAATAVVQTITVTQGTSRTMLAVTSGGTHVNNVAKGSAVTLTATVEAGTTPVPTGAVNFCDASSPHCTDIHLLGTAQLTSAGTASMTYIPGLGNRSYKAVFVATASAAASSSPQVNLSVTGTYPTTTTIAQSGSAGNYSLTATVAGAGSNKVGPGGTVSFLDTSNGNFSLGSQTLGASTYTQSVAVGSTSTVGLNPGSIVSADFNGDGIQDLATANADDTISILLGKGNGQFAAKSSLSMSTDNSALAVGDFNGDGIPDLASASDENSTVTILLGNGDGTFTLKSSLGTGSAPLSIAVADFNGDGIQDLATANYDSGTATILLGNGDGTFTAAATSPAAGNAPYSVAAGDFNGDGKVDLAVTNESSNTVTILLGNGDGTFTLKSAPAVGWTPISISVADFNGDGKADLAVANESSNTVTILLGNGDGTFTLKSSLAVGWTPISISVADFNCDGKADLAVANLSTSSISILRGNGDGTFTAAGSPTALVTSITSADFNGDGVPDLAYTAGHPGNSVTILLTSLTATATAAVTGISPDGSGTHNVEASYPGNSSFAAGTSATTPLTAQAAPTTITLSTNPATITFGQQVTLTATLSPYSGQNHSTDGEPISFYIDSSTPVPVAGTLSSGVATLTVVLGSGTHSLSISYPGDTNFASATSVAQSFTVNPASQTVSLSGLPATATFGSAGPYTLSASASTNLPVTLSVTGPATLSGSTLTVTGPGTIMVTASQAGNANYAAASASSTLTVLGKSAALLTSINASSKTATIDVFGFGFTPPTGSLSFTDMTSNNPVASNVALLASNATTALTPQTTANTGTNTLPCWTVLADINGDGKQDLITSLFQTDSLSVQLGNGDGTFQPATNYPISSGFGPAESHLFSLRGNGIQDIVVASYNLNEIAVLLGNGNGTFQTSATIYHIGSSGNWIDSLTAGYFNGDTHLDIATANTGDNTVSILLGDGDGNLTLQQPAIPIGHDPEAIRAGDFNGDGYSDLAVANHNDGTVTTLFNNQNGTFTPTVHSIGSGAHSGPQALAFHGSGTSLQMAVANSNDNTVSILNSNGDGSFAPQTIVSTGKGPDDLTFADFNGDGIADLAVSNYTDGTVDLLLASPNPGGSYTLAGSFKVGNNPYSAAVADIDSDGTPDIVVSNCFSNNTGTLLSGTLIAVPYAGIALTTGDNIQASYAPDANSKYAESISNYTATH